MADTENKIWLSYQRTSTGQRDSLAVFYNVTYHETEIEALRFGNEHGRKVIGLTPGQSIEEALNGH